MKQFFSDKRIRIFETIIIVLMVLLAVSLVYSMTKVNLSGITNRDFFNCVALIVCMALSLAIAFSIRLSHRNIERWHIFYMLILILNYICMYLDAWVWVHGTTKAAASTSITLIFIQVVCIFLMHFFFICFVNVLTDKKKLMRISVLLIIALLCGFAFYIFCFVKPVFPPVDVTTHSGESRLLAGMVCMLVLAFTAVPALFSKISVKWKISIASYPCLFAIVTFSYFLNSDYLFTFQAISLSCMCSYCLMYADIEDPAKVSASIDYEIADNKDSMLETKIVSVMKVSLRDFAYIAAYMNESVTIDLTDTFLKEMMDTVAFFGGRVVSFPACSFIAVFGIEENNAGFRARSVGAALEIIDKMENINAWCKKKNYPRVYASTSIVTDVMTMGYVGEDDCRTFTIMGEATELCDKLEKFCGEGEILVSESTLEKYNSPIHMQERGVLNKRDNTAMTYFKVSKASQ